MEKNLHQIKLWKELNIIKKIRPKERFLLDQINEILILYYLLNWSLLHLIFVYLYNLYDQMNNDFIHFRSF